MAQKTTKAAISGISGFIGRALSLELSKKGWEVRRVSQELVYSPTDLQAFFDDYQPDYIFHLGAYGNMSNQKDVSLTIFSNYVSCANMLQASLDTDYKAFIQIGSSSEYGKTDRPMSESHQLRPETFYAASKGAASLLAEAFRKQFQKPIYVVRPFSVYGPGEADFRFIPFVIGKMLKNEAFQLEENAQHDWIYIEDFIDALLEISEKTPEEYTINVGTGRSHTNKEVVQMLQKISGIQYLANPTTGQRPDDSSVWIADNSILTSLGWHPETMLLQGLEKCWVHYQKYYLSKWERENED